MSKKRLHFLAPSKPSTILFSALLLISGVIGAQERIGVAAAVDTTTTDLTLEQERKLVDEGYKIIQNHTIETDENGKAQMLLVDGTAFTVGPNSSVTLDSFIYNPETAEGSLTVTSKGLMRLVGGKVTKNNPAIIRTNAATVGIRGGIVFVDSQGETTEASFIYGDEMTVTPSLNQDGTYVLTRNGFVVVVDDPLEDVEDVSLLTAEQLLSMQQSLQGSPEEEEESEEESSEEGESEEERIRRRRIGGRGIRRRGIRRRGIRGRGIRRRGIRGRGIRRRGIRGRGIQRRRGIGGRGIQRRRVRRRVK
jgi:hypothetical protein